MAYVRYVLADENRSLRTLLQPVSRSRQEKASRLCHESRDALLSLEPPVFGSDRERFAVSKRPIPVMPDAAIAAPWIG